MTQLFHTIRHLHFDNDGIGGISQFLSPTGRVLDLHGGTGAMRQLDIERFLLRQSDFVELAGKLLARVVQHSNKSVSFC